MCDPRNQIPASGFNPGQRADGSNKGTGYMGVLTNAKGSPISEYSIGVEIGGKQMDIPSIVPTLSAVEIKSVLDASANDQMVSPQVIRKATAFAQQRLAEGKSVWANSPKISGARVGR
jgi:hypothetical protein